MTLSDKNRRQRAISEDSRFCNGCSKVLPLSKFYSVKTRSKGVSQQCKCCSSIQTSNWLNRLYNTIETSSKDIVGRARVTANTRGILFDLTPEQIVKIYHNQLGLCHYTRLPLANTFTSGQRTSIDRIDSNRLYKLGNIALCCADVNLMKQDWSVDQFATLCRDVTYPISNTTVTDISSKHLTTILKTKLRYLRHRAKAKNRECTLTINTLLDMWINQQGRCAYTNYSLLTPTTNNISVERVDSNVGYIPTNSIFAHTSVNVCKRSLEINLWKSYCKLIYDNYYPNQNKV